VAYTQTEDFKNTVGDFNHRSPTFYGMKQEQKAMGSVTEQPSLPNRKAELEQQKALLQMSALMRLRTNQPESKLSELAHKRISQQLGKKE